MLNEFRSLFIYHLPFTYRNHPTTSANVEDEGGSNRDQSSSTKQNRSSAPSDSRRRQARNKRNAKGQSVGDDNTSDELPEDDGDDNPPDPPPMAGTSSTRKEIRHETNICLQVLIDGKSIGKLKVITKIKVFYRIIFVQNMYLTIPTSSTPHRTQNPWAVLKSRLSRGTFIWKRGLMARLSTPTVQ